MQSRGIWVALGLAVLVGGLIWWSEEDEKRKAEKPTPKADAPRILEIPLDQFQRVELKRAGRGFHHRAAAGCGLAHYGAASLQRRSRRGAGDGEGAEPVGFSQAGG